MPIHSKLSIAEKQLESAVALLVSGGDKFSAITLSGAADTIISQLLIAKGEESFVDSLRKRKGIEKSLGEYGREINNILGINDLKHMDKDCSRYIHLDLETCALGAVSKAIASYIRLNGRSKDFIKAFTCWVQTNVDTTKYGA
jgi:hypothetical protein